MRRSCCLSTWRLSKVRPEDFARRYLVETMRASKVLVGENFRFGHRQEGNVESLEAYGRQWGFEVESVKSLTVDGTVASSSAIREALRSGRVEDARRMLGRPFALSGEIQTGTGQGRKLVVPTLNLKTEQEMLPKQRSLCHGNSRGRQILSLRHECRRAANVQRIGRHGRNAPLDFNENLNGGQIEIRFLERLRDERKFAGVEELREQVLKISEARRNFSERSLRTTKKTEKSRSLSRFAPFGTLTLFGSALSAISA